MGDEIAGSRIMGRSASPMTVWRREATVWRDAVRLAARLVLPSAPLPAPCVVFVHGLGSSKDSPRNVVIAEHLVDAGIAAVLFDLSGHGDSTDDPRGAGAYVDDVASVYAWARDQTEVDADRMGIAGSSMGATVALDAVLAGRVQPAAMVLRAPPVDPGAFDALDVPTLVLIGEADPLLPNVEPAAERGHAVTLSVVAGAGHLFEEPGALQEALDRTVAWFREHLAAA